MISRYSDHAANERTYLAWVRTAITVMAFGFLVEKFDVFLQVTALSLGGRPPYPPTWRPKSSRTFRPYAGMPGH